jgi:hypothetical protein
VLYQAGHAIGALEQIERVIGLVVGRHAGAKQQPRDDRIAATMAHDDRTALWMGSQNLFQNHLNPTSVFPPRLAAVEIVVDIAEAALELRCQVRLRTVQENSLESAQTLLPQPVPHMQRSPVCEPLGGGTTPGQRAAVDRIE